MGDAIRPDSEFGPELDQRPEDSLFSKLYGGDPPSRELARSEQLVALADLAPLVPGHLLVVPREYAPSFAVLPEPAWRDWEILRERLVDALKRQWADPVIYEHGSTGAMRGSACITHAHLQLVPGALDLVHEMEDDGLRVIQVRDQRDIRTLSDAERPYFYVEAAGRGHFAWADDPQMPSQYLRRIAARALGLDDPMWDWGIVVRRELLRETVHRLAG